MINYQNNVPYIPTGPQLNPLRFLGTKENPVVLAWQEEPTLVPDLKQINNASLYTRSAVKKKEEVSAAEYRALEQLMGVEEGAEAGLVTMLSPYIGMDQSQFAFFRANYFNAKNPFNSLGPIPNSELPETEEEMAKFKNELFELNERLRTLPEEQRSQAEKDKLFYMTRQVLQLAANKAQEKVEDVTFLNHVWRTNPIARDIYKLGLGTALKINELTGMWKGGWSGMSVEDVQVMYNDLEQMDKDAQLGEDIVERLNRKDPFFDPKTWFSTKYSSPEARLFLLEKGITADSPMIKNAPNADAAEFMVTRGITRSEIQRRMALYSPDWTESTQNTIKSFGMAFVNSPDLVPLGALELVTGGPISPTNLARQGAKKLLAGPLKSELKRRTLRGAVYALDTVLKVPLGFAPIYSQNLKLMGRLGLSASLVGVGTGLQELSRQRTQIAFAAAALQADPDAMREYDFGMMAMAAGQGALLGLLGFGLLPATISSSWGALKNKMLGVNLAPYGRPVLRSPSDFRFSFAGTVFGETLSSFKGAIEKRKTPVDLPVNEKLALEAATTGRDIPGSRLISAVEERVDRVETRTVETVADAENLVEDRAAKRAVNETKEAWLQRIIPSRLKISFGEFLSESGRKLPDVGDNLNVEGDTYNSLSLKDKFLVLAESGKLIDRAIELESALEGGITPERQAMYAQWKASRKKGMNAIRNRLTKVEWEALRKEFNQGVKLPPIPESIAKLRNNALGVAERKQAANELAAKVLETARQILANPQKAGQLRAVLPKEVMAAVDSAALEQATRGRISEATAERIKADMAGEKPRMLNRLSALYHDSIIANRLDPVRTRKIQALMDAPTKFVDLIDGNKANATRFYNHINELLNKDMISTAERDLVLAATVHLNFDSKAFGVDFKIDRITNEDGTINRLAVGRFSAENNSIIINSGWVGSGLSGHRQRAMTILHELGHAYFYHKAVPTVYLDSLRLYNNALDPNIVSFTAIEPVTGDPLLDVNFLTRLQLQNVEETFVQTFAQILTTEADVAIKAFTPIQVSMVRSTIDNIAKSIARTAALFDSSSHYKAAANIIDAVVDLDNKLSRQVSVPELMRGYAKARGDGNVERFNQTLKTFFAQQGKPFRNEHMLTAGEYGFIFNRNTDPSLLIAMGIMKAQGKTIVDAAGKFTKDVVDMIPIYREYKKAQLNSMKSKIAFLLGTHDYKLLEGMDRAERLQFIQDRLFDISSKKFSSKSALEQVLPATYEDELFRDMKTADFLDPEGKALRYADGYLRTTVEPFILALEAGEIVVPAAYRGPTQGLSRILSVEERTALANELRQDDLLSKPLIVQTREFFNAQGLNELGEIVTDSYSQVFYKQLVRSGGVFDTAKGKDLILDLYYSKTQQWLESKNNKNATFQNKEQLMNALKGAKIQLTELKYVGLKEFLDNYPSDKPIKVSELRQFFTPVVLTEVRYGSTKRKLTAAELWTRDATEKMFRLKKETAVEDDFGGFDDIPEAPTTVKPKKAVVFYGYLKGMQYDSNVSDTNIAYAVPDYERTVDALLRGEELPEQGYVMLSSDTETPILYITPVIDKAVRKERARATKAGLQELIQTESNGLFYSVDKDRIDAHIKDNKLSFKDIETEVVEPDGRARWDENAPTSEEVVIPGGVDHGEIVFKVNDEFFKLAGNYTHIHFPNDNNFVFHVRFNTRINSKGEKILFIEEIQSDLHERAREVGYFGENVPLSVIDAKAPRLINTLNSFVDGENNTYTHVSLINHKVTVRSDLVPGVNTFDSYLVMEVKDSAGQVKYEVRSWDTTRSKYPVRSQKDNDVLLQEWKTLPEKQTFATKAEAETHAKLELQKKLTAGFKHLDQNQEARANLKNTSYLRPANVPFNSSDVWANIILSRMAKHAAANDFKRIAWANGKVHARRYKKLIEYPVSRILVQETEPGSNAFLLEWIDTDGTSVETMPKPIAAKELKAWLGKEYETLLLQKLDDHYKEGKFNEALAIDVKPEHQTPGYFGGKGYTEYYDNIVTREARDLFGVTVDKTDINTKEDFEPDMPSFVVDNKVNDKISSSLPLRFDIAKLPQWKTKEEALNNLDHLVKEKVEMHTVFAIIKKNLQGNTWDALKTNTESPEDLVVRLRRLIENERIIYSEISKTFIAAPKKRPAVDVKPGVITTLPPKEKAVLPAPRAKPEKKTRKQRAIELAKDDTVVTGQNFWDVMIALNKANPQFLELDAAIRRTKKLIESGKLIITTKKLAAYLQTALEKQEADARKAGTMPVGVTGDGQGRKARKRVSIETEEGKILEGVKPFYTTKKREESSKSAKARFKNLMVEMINLNNYSDGQLLNNRDIAFIQLFQLVEDMPDGIGALAAQLGKNRRTISRWKANLIEKLEGIKKDLDIRASDALTEEGIKDTVQAYLKQVRQAVSEAKALPKVKVTKTTVPSAPKARKAGAKAARTLAKNEKLTNPNPTKVTTPQATLADNTATIVTAEVTGKTPEEVLRREKQADAIIENDPSTTKEVVAFTPKNPLKTVYDSLDDMPEDKLNNLRELGLRAGYDALVFKDGSVLPLRAEDVVSLGRVETEVNPTGMNVTKIDTKGKVPVRRRIPDPTPTQQETPAGTPVTLSKTGNVRPPAVKAAPTETVKTDEITRVERKINEERDLLRANGMDTSAFKRFLSMYWRKMKDIDTDRTSPLSGTFKLMWSKFVYLNTEIFTANRALVGDAGIARFWELVDQYKAEERMNQAAIPAYQQKSDNQIYRRAAEEVNPDFLVPVLPNELAIKVDGDEPRFTTKNNKIKRLVEQNKAERDLPAPPPKEAPLDAAAAKQDEVPAKLEETQAKEVADLGDRDNRIRAAILEDDQNASLPLRQTNWVGAAFGGSNRESRNWWRELTSAEANAVQTASGTGRTIRSMQSIVRFFARMMDDTKGQTGHLAAAGKEMPKTALQCKTEEQFMIARVLERQAPISEVLQRYPKLFKPFYTKVWETVSRGGELTPADVKAVGITDNARAEQLAGLGNDYIKLLREVNSWYLDLGVESGLLNALDANGMPVDAQTFLPTQFDGNYLSQLSAAKMENLINEMVRVRTSTKLSDPFLDINTMIVMGWLDVAPTSGGRRADLLSGEREFLPGSTTNTLSPETLKTLELETHHKVPGRSSRGLLEELASSGKPQEYFVIEYPDKFVVYRLPKEIADLSPRDLQKYKETVVGNQSHYTNKWREALGNRNLVEVEMREELDFKTKRGQYSKFNAETSTNIDRPLIRAGGNRETALAVPGLRPQEILSSPVLMDVTRINLAEAYSNLFNGRVFEMLFQKELNKKFGKGINFVNILSFAYREGLQNIQDMAKVKGWTGAQIERAETDLRLGISRIREEYAINADTLPYLHNPELYGHRLTLALVKSMTAWGYGLAQMGTENLMVLARLLATRPTRIPNEIITGLRMLAGDYRFKKSALMRSPIGDMAFNVDNFRHEFGNRFLGEFAHGAFSTDDSFRTRFGDSRPSLGTRDTLVKGVETVGRVAESVGSLQASTSWGRAMARSVVERNIWRRLKNGNLEKLVAYMSTPENQDLLNELLKDSYRTEAAERKLIKTFAKKVRESGYGYSHYDAMMFFRYRINTVEKVQHLKWLLENSGVDSEGRTNMFRMADTTAAVKQNPPEGINPSLLEEVLSDYQFILNQETIRISSPEPRGLARITDTQLNSVAGRLWYAMTSWLRGYHDQVVLDYSTKGSLQYIAGSLVMIGLFDAFSGLFRELLAGRAAEDIIAELEEDPMSFAIRAAKSAPILGPANGVIEAALSLISTLQGGTWRYYGNPLGSIGINAAVAGGAKMTRGLKTMGNEALGAVFQGEEFDVPVFAAALGDVLPINPIITRSPVAIPVRSVEGMVNADKQGAMQRWLDEVQKEEYPYLSEVKRKPTGRHPLVPFTPRQVNVPMEVMRLESARQKEKAILETVPEVKPTDGVSSVLADLLKRPL